MQDHPDEHDSAEDEVSESGEEQAVRQNGNGTKRRRKWNSMSKDEGPACQACRRKKAKCSRQQPCSQCEKNQAQCIYDEAKNKPGMRVGAIEHLTQRLATLENMFMGQSLVWQQVWRHLETVGGSGSSDDSPGSQVSPALASGSSLQSSTSQLRKSLAAIGRDAGEREPTTSVFNPMRSPKRRRVEDEQFHAVSWGASLPPDDIVDSLVDIYFERIHPWIPMLHVTRFRRDMADTNRRRIHSSILHAITSLCVRFSDDPRLGDARSRAAFSKRSRETVILQSMESFSVINLQALIICSFDTIASGRGPSAWSIVGSMTRTAEQLQLSVEDGDIHPSETASNGIISRIAFLPPPVDWCEEEERRRVFWNIFLMDRFCSISTGWNLSLTSADARRRLPCEGSLWEAGHRLEHPTPYFGLSDQTGSAGCALPDIRPESQDQNALGGFAYAIEATESLSLVTSFFLQQTVDISRPQQVQVWLMRFKQLDLRLVQWKVFLPERWREACAVNVDGNMDPNLTLAHITHNTAVVLLHQGIAYPSAGWNSTAIKLPSQSSAETCMAAAVEVATIAEHFLRNSRFLANHQFAFCLFVCGRMLLAHATYFQTPLADSFNSLVSSLREISSRWSGASSSGGTATPFRSANLASKFASRLCEARDLGPTTFDIRKAAYSDEGQNGDDTADQGTIRVQPLSTDFPGALKDQQGAEQIAWSPGNPSGTGNTEASPDSISLAFPPLPQAFQSSSSTDKRIDPAASMQAMNNGVLYGFPHLELESAQMPDAGGPRDTGFEDISAYLDGSFMPDQRISMYSQQAFQTE